MRPVVTHIASENRGRTRVYRVQVDAEVVGSDDVLCGRRHLFDYGMLLVTKRSVKVRWTMPMSKAVRTYPVPKTGKGRSLRHLGERLGWVVAPRHAHMFRHRPASDLCKQVHDFLTVEDVMRK